MWPRHEDPKMSRQDAVCKIWRPEDGSDMKMKTWDVRIWDVKVRRCDASAKMRCGCEDARCRSEMWRCSGWCDTQRHKMLQVRSFYMLTLSQQNSFTHNLFHIQMFLFPHKHTTVQKQRLLHVCAQTLPLHSKVLTRKRTELWKANLLDGALKGKSSCRSS